MLTIKQIRDDKQAAIRKLAKKGVDAAPVIARIETLDDRRKAIQTELDNTLAAQNKAAKEIGALMGQGRRDEAEERKRFVADLKEKSNRLQAESHNVQEELQAAIVSLPNFPADIVPEGKTAEDNLVVKLVESYTQLPENPLPHWELARKYDIIDFDLGVKLTGAGFPVYKGKGARLQRALINYFLDCNTRAGYLEVEPPIMVNEASGFGTGQLPDKEGQMYHATADNFYMIPTAEVPVTNIYRDVILDEKDFPVKMTAYTPCFHELTELEGSVDGVKNYNIAVKKRGEDITFLRRIVRGPADDSYGIEVAKLAGLPGSVTRRAHEVLRALEASAPKNKVEQMDFDALQEYNSPAVPSEMMEKLEALDVETLTPIEALNFLYELKKTLKGSLNS